MLDIFYFTMKYIQKQLAETKIVMQFTRLIIPYAHTFPSYIINTYRKNMYSYFFLRSFKI